MTCNNQIKINNCVDCTEDGKALAEYQTINYYATDKVFMVQVGQLSTKEYLRQKYKHIKFA